MQLYNGCREHASSCTHCVPSQHLHDTVAAIPPRNPRTEDPVGQGHRTYIPRSCILYSYCRVSWIPSEFHILLSTLQKSKVPMSRWKPILTSILCSIRAVPLLKYIFCGWVIRVIFPTHFSKKIFPLLYIWPTLSDEIILRKRKYPPKIIHQLFCVDWT